MSKKNNNKPASSWIKGIGWHGEVLSIWTKDTVRYDYFNVPKSVFDLFEKCDSKGRYFHEHIDGQYEYVKVICEAPKAA